MPQADVFELVSASLETHTRVVAPCWGDLPPGAQACDCYYYCFYDQGNPTSTSRRCTYDRIDLNDHDASRIRVCPLLGFVWLPGLREGTFDRLRRVLTNAPPASLFRSRPQRRTPPAVYVAWRLYTTCSGCSMRCVVVLHKVRVL